jgi:hypothetical protein
VTTSNNNNFGSGRVAAIHQPNFLPWLGFFYKWRQSDVFVRYDDVQFVRRGYTNRVKIKTQKGEAWITVPVKQKGNYHQAIGEIEIDREVNWKRKLLGTLTASYSRAPFFKMYFPRLEEILANDFRLLVQLNTALLSWVAGELNIDVPSIEASVLENISGASTERLVSVCRALGASHYLSGFGGQKYQEERLFVDNGIQLKVYNFKHPRYPQLWGDFIPGLSVLDLLFNCGGDSPAILDVDSRLEE